MQRRDDRWQDRGQPGWVVAMFAIAGVVLGLWFSAGKVFAAEPYGGCDEGWQAPHSAGADWCRDHGWIIRHRLVVDPHKVLRMTKLPGCYVEDGSGEHCIWRGSVEGNHRGLTYYLNRPEHPRYVWEFDPTGSGWRWVTNREDRNLDRSHHRHWQRCVINYGSDRTAIRCPNGTRWTAT